MIVMMAMVILMFLGAIPASASSEARCGELTNVIKCEDFNEGTPGSWPHGAGSTWVGSSGTGPVWGNLDPGWTTGTTFSELVTTTPCGARGRSLHLRTTGSGGGGVGFTDTQRLIISPGVTEIRIRYNLCMDTNFDSNFSAPGNEDGIHSLFLSTATSGVGVRFDLYSYANGEPAGSTDSTITYNGTTYVVKHPWGPECGNDSGARGYFNIASPQGWPLIGNLFLAVDYNHGETAAGGAGSPVAPNLCKNIHNVFFSGGVPRWVVVERAYKILPAGTSFTCSTTCPTRLALANIIIDGTSVLNDWPVPPDIDYLTIDALFFDQFISTLGAGNLDGYYDDVIVTSNYATVIGAVSAGGGSSSGGSFDVKVPDAPTMLTVQK